jgi:hypothetical protein
LVADVGYGGLVLTHKRIAILVLVTLILTTAFSEPAIAMSGAHRTSEQVRAALTHLDVGHDTTVSIKLRNNKIVVGHLTAIGDFSFWVTDPETQIVTQVAFSNVKQLSALSNRARITIAAGVIGAALLIYLWCYGAGGCGGVS